VNKPKKKGKLAPTTSKNAAIKGLEFKVTAKQGIKSTRRNFKDGFTQTKDD